MTAAKFPSTKPGAAQAALLWLVLAGLLILIYYTGYDRFSPVYRLPRPRPFFRVENDPWWREVVCKRAGHWEEEPGTPLKKLFRDVTPEKDKNIFLMDTACNSNPKYRVWCSVESWAKQHPNRQVWFLFTAGGMAEAELPHILLHRYPNLHVVDVDLEELFRGSPLVPLFNSRKWSREDTWPVELLSDMLRVLVLWRWGGVYSDTDVLSIRPFTLPFNALGFENPHQIGSAFYSFHAQNPMLLDLMEDMQENFDPRQWGSIGPLAISRVVEQTCKKNLKELSEKAPTKCPGNLMLFPRRSFYPIPYPAYGKFFNPGEGKDFDKMFNETFTLHLWNKMSKGTEMKVNSSSIYEVAARKVCPLTFQIATAESDVF